MGDSEGESSLRVWRIGDPGAEPLGDWLPSLSLPLEPGGVRGNMMDSRCAAGGGGKGAFGN